MRQAPAGHLLLPGLSFLRGGSIMDGMYSTTTDNVTVTVSPAYLAQESAPEKSLYVWAYTVRIENGSAVPFQLRRRFWRITDGYGRTQEVSGAGVCGEEPFLHPGEAYEYTSGTPLPTPHGIMAGHYTMEAGGGRLFDVDIPAFSLDTPHAPRQLN